MHVRALKTFHSKYGLIRKKTIFQPEPNYAKALMRNRLVEEVTEEDARAAIASGAQRKIPGPGEQREDKSIPAAPNKKGPTPGKSQPGKAAQPGSTTAATPDAGKEPKSSASDRGQASPAKTLTSSTVGGRRATTTPKRKRGSRQVIAPAKPEPDA